MLLKLNNYGPEGGLESGGKVATSQMDGQGGGMEAKPPSNGAK